MDMTTEYPKWMFSASAAPQLVADAAAQAALGLGWYDTPTLTDEAAFTPTPTGKAAVELSAAKAPVFREFPKWLYSKASGPLESRSVPDEAAAALLGAGWYEHPDECPVPAESGKASEKSKAGGAKR